MSEPAASEQKKKSGSRRPSKFLLVQVDGDNLKVIQPVSGINAGKKHVEDGKIAGRFAVITVRKKFGGATQTTFSVTDEK